jgi:hypothetical protein
MKLSWFSPKVVMLTTWRLCPGTHARMVALPFDGKAKAAASMGQQGRTGADSGKQSICPGGTTKDESGRTRWLSRTGRLRWFRYGRRCAPAYSTTAGTGVGTARSVSKPPRPICQTEGRRRTREMFSRAAWDYRAKPHRTLFQAPWDYRAKPHGTLCQAPWDYSTNSHGTIVPTRMGL